MGVSRVLERPRAQSTIAARSDAYADASTDDARVLAFRRLANQHLDRNYRLAAVVLGDPAEAQDAVHDAFVTAWRKVP